MKTTQEELTSIVKAKGYDPESETDGGFTRLSWKTSKGGRYAVCFDKEGSVVRASIREHGMEYLMYKACRTTLLGAPIEPKEERWLCRPAPVAAYRYMTMERWLGMRLFS